MAGYKAEKRNPPAALPAVERLPPESLSEAERQRAAETAQQAKQLMPEIVPFVKELYEAGMIDGWRNVTITPLNGDENGHVEQSA